MQTFVINLDTDVDRRESAERQLNEARLDFQFFPAVRGENAKSGHFNGFDEFACVLNIGRSMTDNEFGCFASHRNLWKKCAESGAPMLIFEDDFQLREGFAGAVREVERSIDEFGFIRLQRDLRARKTVIRDCTQFKLSRFTKAPHGLMCYAISAAVARDFVAQTRNIDAPVDVFIKKYWDHRCPLFAITPYTVVPSRLSLETSIPGREKHRKPLHIASLRFLTKCTWVLRRVAFNLVA